MIRALLVTVLFLLTGLLWNPVTQQGGGDSSPAAGGPVTASFTASRTNGVAPYYVFFDATATTHSDASVTEYGDLHYAWDFDEANSTWTTTGKRRDIATGPIQGYVFETAGTFTVSLTVTDGDGNTASADTVDITVTAPDTVYSTTNTTCISDTADMTGCPSGATQRASQTDFDAELATCLADDQRCLFRGGGTFTNSATTSFSLSTERATVGSFGTGRAIVNSTVTIFDTQAASDVRIMDLDTDLADTSGAIFLAHNSAGTNTTHVTISNVDATNCGAQCILIMNTGAEDFHDHIAIINSTFQKDGGDDNPVLFMGLERSLVAGNTVQYGANAGMGEHWSRYDFGRKLIIANNDHQCESTCDSASQHQIKIARNEGAEYSQSGDDNHEHWLIQDNLFEGGSTEPIGGSNTAETGNPNTMIVERNFYLCRHQQNFITLEYDNMWIRNNIVVDAAGDTCTANPKITISNQDGYVPDNVKVFGNLCADENGTQGGDCIRFMNSTTNTVARNNLAVHVSGDVNCDAGNEVVDTANGSPTTSNNFCSEDSFLDSFTGTTWDAPGEFEIDTTNFADLASVENQGFAEDLDDFNMLDEELVDRADPSDIGPREI